MKIGIDLGGTKIEGVIIDPDQDHHIVKRLRIPTNPVKGYDHIVSQTVAFIEEISESLPPDIPVGMGMPGSVTKNGRIKNANTVCLNDRFFRQEVQSKLHRPIRFANDANCFALAEAILGAGKGHSVVFGVILGTGVGGGIVFDGIVREGPHSICGEWGHTILAPDHPQSCFCKKNGCVEQFLAGPSVRGRFAKESGQDLAIPDILALGQAGNPQAMQFIDHWMDLFGRALSNVINVLDPDVVVLGGGVSNSPCLYTTGAKKVQQYIFSDEANTPILKNQLGDSAGVIGAALLW